MSINLETAIKKAFKIIEDNIGDESAYFCGSIGLETIIKAEKILNVQFPKSYIQFLQRYGEGNLFGIEIYGIIKNPVRDIENMPTMVSLTQDERKNELVLLPKELVIISETGYGPYYVLDTSQMDENQECPVYMWDVGDIREKVADSFGDFLFDELKDMR